MAEARLEPIFCDNHLIAVCKPFGLLTQSDRPGRISLLDQTRTWIKSRFHKPGRVYLGLIHRLDRPVAGLVLFARTSKAASRLSSQFREKRVRKFYRAVVIGIPKNQKGELVHYLKKNPKTKKTTVFPRETSGAQRAELAYHMIKPVSRHSILEIELRTGRFHQIRAQLAFNKTPILGDVKYGAFADLPGRHIALFASQLTFQHPVTQHEMTLKSPEPPGWPFVGMD